MKPVKLYFAGAWAGKCNEEESRLGIKNKLVSYLYPDQLESWYAVSKGKEGNIIIDSGAFSAWTRGLEIDLGKYAEYCHEMIYKGEQDGKAVKVVNIDVIPGRKGNSSSLNKVRSEANQNLIEDAAKEGYKNLKRLIGKGLTPIHVFHQGERWEWLHKMVELTDYIGISPANDLSVTSRKAWMASVFEYMEKHNIKVDTHGFAVWMPSILKSLPFTSCDAVTWRVLAAWGGIYYPVGGFTNPDYSKGPHILHVSARKSAKGLTILTEKKLEMIEQDGYTYEELQKWETRAKINIRYFLEFEQWLNTYRASKTFTIRDSLFGHLL